MRNLPDWLQEFRENLVDESVPAEPRGNPSLGHRDTSSSSHELPMEPRAKVEPGSGKLTLRVRLNCRPKIFLSGKRQFKLNCQINSPTG